MNLLWTELRKDAKGLREIGRWYRAEMMESAANEIDRLNDRINRLEEFVDQLTNPKFTRDDLPKEALLQYIKRLEEAGDRIIEAGWSVQDWSGMCVVWAKAKEAKP